MGAFAAGNPDAGAIAPAPAPRSLLAPLPQVGAARPPRDEYQLERAKDGSGDLIYEASGFTARVARDGAVRFRDRHGTVHFFPYLPFIGGRGGARPPGPAVSPLEEVIRNGLARRRTPTPAGPPPDPIANETLSPSTTFSRFRPDPREACLYPSPCFFEASVVLVGLQGTFDVTDELMRLAGKDPYRYEKARFLTATRELRGRMAGRAHAEDVTRSGAELPHRLRQIACDDRLSVADRRAIIEALRAELDGALPEARAQADRIGRFLDDWDRSAAGGAGIGCPPREPVLP